MNDHYLLIDKRLGAAKTPEENFGTIEQFTNRMRRLVENRKDQGELLRELIKCVEYNFLDFCEPDKQRKIKQEIESILRGIK